MTLLDTTALPKAATPNLPVPVQVSSSATAQEPATTGTTQKIKWRLDESVADLLASLRFRRPKGGPTEQRFINQFIDVEIDDLKQDEVGNIYKIVGQDNPTILWSCHTDSVHRMEGEQHVVVEGDWIRLPKNSKSNCLGADDMAGIWLLRQMIKAGVPGLYIFHYGEESGGIGSGYIADKHPEYLEGIKVAIAFDRRNFNDIITHQAGGRCCSDDFATSLAMLLPNGYKPSSHGIFTDTANYTRLIPECTNVSVGYFDEHTSAEKLNIPHILSLRDALVKITQADLDGLIIQRDPTVDEWDDFGFGMGGFASWRSSSRRRERSQGIYTGKYGTKYQHLGETSQQSDFLLPDDMPDAFEEAYGDLGGSSFYPTSMEQLLEEYPRSAAKVLEDYGFTVEDLFDEINRNRG